MTDDFDKLKEYLQGVKILLSAVDARVVSDQKEIFRAAKEVGVERLVPCDWGTPGARGIRVLFDVVSHSHDFGCDAAGGLTTAIPESLPRNSTSASTSSSSVSLTRSSMSAGGCSCIYRFHCAARYHLKSRR